MGSAGRESKSSYRAVPESKAREVTGMEKVGLCSFLVSQTEQMSRLFANHMSPWAVGGLSTHVDEARVSLVTIGYGCLSGGHITGQTEAVGMEALFIPLPPSTHIPSPG